MKNILILIFIVLCMNSLRANSNNITLSNRNKIMKAFWTSEAPNIEPNFCNRCDLYSSQKHPGKLTKGDVKMLLDRIIQVIRPDGTNLEDGYTPEDYTTLFHQLFWLNRKSVWYPVRAGCDIFLLNPGFIKKSTLYLHFGEREKIFVPGSVHVNDYSATIYLDKNPDIFRLATVLTHEICAHGADLIKTEIIHLASLFNAMEIKTNPVFYEQTGATSVNWTPPSYIAPYTNFEEKQLFKAAMRQCFIRLNSVLHSILNKTIIHLKIKDVEYSTIDIIRLLWSTDTDPEKSYYIYVPNSEQQVQYFGWIKDSSHLTMNDMENIIIKEYLNNTNMFRVQALDNFTFYVGKFSNFKLARALYLTKSQRYALDTEEFAHLFSEFPGKFLQTICPEAGEVIEFTNLSYQNLVNRTCTLKCSPIYGETTP